MKSAFPPASCDIVRTHWPIEFDKATTAFPPDRATGYRVRIGSAEGLEHELKQMVSSQIVDPDHITIYETSGFWNTYYTTSMGLFLQAMLDKDDPPQAWLDRAPRAAG